MLGILAVLYAMYALSLKKWDYATEAKRQERRTLLKTKGVSNTFYFIHAGTLFLLNVFSGGLFTFYWLYRQWTAVPHGFRRLNAQPLPHGAFLRTVGGFITFFELNAIVLFLFAPFYPYLLLFYHNPPFFANFNPKKNVFLSHFRKKSFLPRKTMAAFSPTRSASILPAEFLESAICRETCFF